jgi:hypothetical protein
VTSRDLGHALAARKGELTATVKQQQHQRTVPDFGVCRRPSQPAGDGLDQHDGYRTVYLEGMPKTDGFRAGMLLLAAQFPGQSHGEVLEEGRDKLGRRFRLAGGPGLALPGVPG